MNLPWKGSFGVVSGGGWRRSRREVRRCSPVPVPRFGVVGGVPVVEGWGECGEAEGDGVVVVGEGDEGDAWGAHGGFV